MNIQQVLTIASKYAPTMKKAAAALPKGRVTVTLAQAKLLAAAKPGSIFSDIIKVTEQLAGKKATITIASKASKMHKGVTLAGIKINQGKKVVAGAAALINQNAGQAASLNLRLRAPGASIHSIFNPNNFTREAVHNGVVDSLTSTRTSKGIIHGNFRLGNAVSATTELNYDKLMQALLKCEPNAKEFKPIYEAAKSTPGDIMEFLRTLFTKGKVTEIPSRSKVQTAITKVLEPKKPQPIAAWVIPQLSEQSGKMAGEISPEKLNQIKNILKSKPVDMKKCKEGLLRAAKQLKMGQTITQDAKVKAIQSKLVEIYGPDKASEMYGKLSSAIKKDPEGVLAAISKHQGKLKW